MVNSKPIQVKGKIIGGKKAQICVPIVAKNFEELMMEIGIVSLIKPDLVEWRVDYYDRCDDTNKVLEALDKVHEHLSELPLIFTLRSDHEGGQRTISAASRVAIIKEVIQSKKIDFIDFELRNEKNFVDEVIRFAREHNVKVILSNHDFQKTPPPDEIVKRLLEAEEAGADIAKIAVMAHSTEDLLTLLNATYDANHKHVKVPIVTMAMSANGLLSRLAGFIFGSSITFASGRDISAPGQISIFDLREVIKLIETNSGIS